MNKHAPTSKTLLLTLTAAAALATTARAQFTPIPLNPSSFNADPVIEASAPPSLNDFVGVSGDAGTNKTGNGWYEIGYNTNIYTPSTYSGPTVGSPYTGLPHPGTVFTAISNANHSFQMAPTYTGNCVIFVGHNIGAWSPILGPGAFKLTAPAAYDHLSILSGTGNGANNIQATVQYQDGSSENIIFSSLDWFTGPNANTAWRAGGLVNMNGSVNNLNGNPLNNLNGNPGTMSFADIILGNTTSPVTNVVFTWFKGNSNGDSPWGNGRTYIFAVSGSSDGGTTYNPITVTGYDHDGVVEATAPATQGTGSAAYTGVLTNNGTYCNFTMDNGINPINWTWYEKGYYAAYPNSGLPAAGSTITSATKPSIQYTMPSTYVGNCAICLGQSNLSDTITFASPTSASSLAFLCGGGNGGLNLRAEIAYQGGSFETNFISVPDWFDRTDPWAYVTFGQVRPEYRAVRNTPDQLQNNWVIPGPYGGLPPGQPFSRDPRNGGASFPNLPIVRLFDAVMPVANGGGLISSIRVVVTDTIRQATATAVLSGTNVTSYTITDGGAGYVSVPAVTITGGGGVAATATAVLNVQGQVVRLTPGNLGSGYTSPPTVTIAAPAGNYGNTVAIFAVSGNSGVPPVITTQPFGLVTDSTTGFTNAITGSATANNIVITKGWAGTNNITLVVSNAPFNSGLSYQWKKAPRGGGWRDIFLTDYNMSTFANVTAPNVGGAQSSIMTISNATLADSADYLVVLSNAYGMQTSFVATVMVLTTNISVLVGAGLGDSLTLYTSDGTTGGSETFLSASDQAAQKWLSTGNGSFGFDGGGVPKATIPFIGPGGYIANPVSGASVVNSIQFYCANDTQGRDPRDYALEGSNDGSTWSTITGGQLLGTLMLPTARGGAGPTALNPFTQPLTEVDFANATAYKQYRVTITNNMEPVATPLMQLAEIRLMGTLIPNPPVWVRQPLPNVTAYVGTSPTWGVQVGGYPPPKFQWYTNGTSASGGTNSTFTLANVQLTDSGKLITCVAFNNAGSITSSPASTLTVIPAPANSYPQAVLANSPKSYWRLDEGPDNGSGNLGVVATDYAGGHNGYYSNALIGVSGYSPFDPDTAMQVGPSPDNVVANINDLDFVHAASLPGTAFSVEAWAFGGNQTVPGAIVAKGYNGNLNPPTQTGTEQFALDVTGNPSTFRFLVREASGQGHVAQSSAVPYDPLLLQPTWRHLVGVCDQPNGNIYLYVDGLLAATGTIPTNSGILFQPLPMIIGSRPSSAAADYDNQWNGTIDDVAVYGSALSASQIFNHFLASQRPPIITLQPTNQTLPENVTATFPTSAYGPGTLGFQWYFSSDGGVNFNPAPAQTSSNLVFTTAAAQDQYQFELVATNQYGSSTSAVVTLTVVSGSPSFIVDLPSAVSYLVGHVIQLHVIAGGTAPFTYGWTTNGVLLSDNYRISGSHTPNLVMAYAAVGDTATYQCWVTNGSGIGSSAGCAVTVAAPGSAAVPFNVGGTGWSLQGSTMPIMGLNRLELTSGLGNTARSAFMLAKQSINTFNVSFVYQTVGGNGGQADGVTFCIQNDSRGAGAPAGAGGGGGLGYTGTTPSVALALNIYTPNTAGIRFLANGGVTPPFVPIAPVLVGGNANPIQINVGYAGGVVTATFKDTITAATYTTNQTVDIPGIVGGGSAYVGFTGADGGVASTQVISNFVMFPPPVKLTAVRSGSNLQLTWPSAAGAYLMSSPTLSPPAWINDTSDTFQLTNNGNTAQVLVPISGAAKFYRLQVFP